jgi:hypothetical protein
VLADRLLDALGVTAGGDDGVTGGKRCLRDVDPHPAAGAGDEPHLLVSQLFVLSVFRGS